MIVKFNTGKYVDVDVISAMTYDTGQHLVCLNGPTIRVTQTEYDLIEQAFLRNYRDTFYKHDGRRLKLTLEKGGA